MNHPQNINTLFEKAFKENLPKVKYYAYSYLEDTELAENISQEAFIQLWQNKEKLNWNESVLPYLLTVTRNLSLNVIRKNKYHLEYLKHKKNSTREGLNYMALEDSSSINIYSKEVESLIQSALDKLDSKVANTFKLVKFKGLSYKEVAQEENVSVKTVESRVTIALKLLRKILHDYLIFLIGYFMS